MDDKSPDDQSKRDGDNESPQRVVCPDTDQSRSPAMAVSTPQSKMVLFSDVKTDAVRQTAPVASRRKQPSTDDYYQYVSNLMDVQSFVQQLHDLLSACDADDEENSSHDLAEDFVNCYLGPLRVYQDDINSIRRRVQSASDDVPELVVELLETVEPQFQSVVSMLDRLQVSITGRKQEKPVASTEPIAASKPLGRKTAEVSKPLPDSQSPPVVDWFNTNPMIPAIPPSTVPKTIHDKSGLEKHDPQRKPAELRTVATAVSGRSIEEWTEGIEKEAPTGRTLWRVDRHAAEFLQSAFEKYKKARPHELSRKFEVFFEEEQGVDRGALTREFFHIGFELTMEVKYKDTRLMVGERGCILPEASARYYAEAYECLGKMIAHAVRHGCYGFPGLSPAIQTYLIYGDSSCDIESLFPPISISDVIEDDLYAALTKLQNGENPTQANRDVLLEWMERSGCRFTINENTRYLVIQHLLIYYTFTMRMKQIDALAAGLDTFGLRQFLKENPTKENISRVFPSPEDMTITPERFKAVVVTRGQNYDVTSWQFFEQFLDELASGAIRDHSLSSLVLFLSGSPYLPAQIVISFSEQGDVLPIAHACFNELQLPTGNQFYEEFRRNMAEGIAQRDFTMDRPNVE